MSVFTYSWEYYVNSDYKNDFIKEYNQQGSWVTLFKNVDGYIKTELLKDRNDGTRFITIDYWKSYEHYKSFIDKYKTEIEELDKKCEAYTVKEKKIGDFMLL